MTVDELREIIKVYDEAKEVCDRLVAAEGLPEDIAAGFLWAIDAIIDQATTVSTHGRQKLKAEIVPLLEELGRLGANV